MDSLHRDHDRGIPHTPGGQEGLLHTDVWDSWKRLNEHTPPNTVTFRTERFKHAYAVALEEPDNLQFQQQMLPEDTEALHMTVNGFVVVHGESIASLLKASDENAEGNEMTFSELLKLAKQKERRDVTQALMRIHQIVNAFGALALKLQQRGRLDILTNGRKAETPQSDAGSDGDVQ